MYKSVSTNNWYNNVKFDSLGKAKKFADNAASKGCCVDIWRFVDNTESRCIYTADGNGSGKAIVGTYKK